MPRLPSGPRASTQPVLPGKEHHIKEHLTQTPGVLVYVEGKARLLAFEQLVTQALKHVPHANPPPIHPAPAAHVLLCAPAAGSCPDGDAMQTFDWPSRVPGLIVRRVPPTKVSGRPCMFTDGTSNPSTALRGLRRRACAVNNVMKAAARHQRSMDRLPLLLPLVLPPAFACLNAIADAVARHNRRLSGIYLGDSRFVPLLAGTLVPIAAATSIQSAWRAYRTRQRLDLISLIRQRRAVLAIQRWWRAELFRERIRMLKAVKRLSLLHAMAGPAHVTGYLDADSLSRLEGDDLLTRVPVFPEHRFAFALDARQNLMALPSGDRGMPHWTGVYLPTGSLQTDMDATVSDFTMAIELVTEGCTTEEVPGRQGVGMMAVTLSNALELRRRAALLLALTWDPATSSGFQLLPGPIQLAGPLITPRFSQAYKAELFQRATRPTGTPLQRISVAPDFAPKASRSAPQAFSIASRMGLPADVHEMPSDGRLASLLGSNAAAAMPGEKAYNACLGMVVAQMMASGQLQGNQRTGAQNLKWTADATVAMPELHFGDPGRSFLLLHHHLKRALHLQLMKQTIGLQQQTMPGGAPQPGLEFETEDDLEAEGEACLRQLQHPPASPGRPQDQAAPEHVSPPSLKDLLQAVRTARAKGVRADQEAGLELRTAYLEAWANERHARAEQTRTAMPRLPPQSCRTGHNFNPRGEGLSARAAAWEVRLQKQQHMEQGRQIIVWLQARQEAAHGKLQQQLRQRAEAAAELKAQRADAQQALALAERIQASALHDRMEAVAAKVQTWHLHRHASAHGRPQFLQRVNALERHLRSAAMSQRSLMQQGAKQRAAAERREADLITKQKARQKQAGLADFRRGQARDVHRSLKLHKEQAATQQKVWQDSQLEAELAEYDQHRQRLSLSATVCQVQGPGFIR
ncbi:hypothetical protein WJX74_003730 [Apatococcus lobatus]|uniref:Uncharacterized protein n=1 Tax=Apatococcus lobatus TaxID=904363 RepID=A0AAW1QBP7_9CHLO